jgi:tetratricopeptide (TPR) repeat protein
LIGFFGFVAIQKIVVAWQLHFAPSLTPDSGLDTSAYADLARRVVAGDIALGPGPYYVSPLYIYVLAVWLKVTGSFTAVRIVQALLGTAAIGCMFGTARIWFNRRAAVWTLVLAGFTGLFSFYEGLILQTSIDTVLTAGALFALSIGLTERDRRALFAAGLVFGLQILNRPNMLVVALAVPALVAMTRERRLAIALTIGLAAGVAPAAARNAMVTGEWSPLPSLGGLNLYIGNGEGATGFYRGVPGITPTIQGQMNDTRAVASRALGHPVTDTEASNYFRDLALTWMSAHPGSAAWLIVRKLGWTFHAQHIALPYSFPFYKYDWPTWLRYLVIGPWLLIPLGLVGLAFGAPADTARRRAYWLWVAFVPAYALSVAMFIVSERYRLPLLVPLAIGAGAAIDMIVQSFRAQQWKSLAAIVTFSALLLTAVNLRGVNDDGRWQEGLRVAQQLAINRQYRESDEWIAKLESAAPQKGMAEEEVGRQYLVEGDLARAKQHLSAAVAADDSRAGAQYALGQVQLGLGDPAGAIPRLERGLAGGVSQRMAGYHLAVALKDAGRTAEAIPVLSKITLSDASPAEDWLAVGRLAMELKVPETAVPFFQKAVQLTPGNADARLQLGVSLVVVRRFSDAAVELTEAVRLNPKAAAGFSYLSYAERQLQRFDQAQRHLQMALALDPNDPMAQMLASMR